MGLGGAWETNTVTHRAFLTGGFSLGTLSHERCQHFNKCCWKTSFSPYNNVLLGRQSGKRVSSKLYTSGGKMSPLGSTEAAILHSVGDVRDL